ncbi:MAG: 3-hydroxyacyl-CoA dehydrogenase family protein [Thermovirgaceae bacterium]
MFARDVRKVCIIGTGTMGSSIALNFAWEGWEVELYARSAESLEKGIKLVQKNIGILVGNGLLEPHGVSQVVNRIQGLTEIEAASTDMPFLIECVSEDLGTKREVFRRLEGHFAKETVFATNTSSLRPTEIAKALERKDRFLAAHFWNPAHLLPLVEIMPGEETAEETVGFTKDIMERIGKDPVVLHKETPGYIGNRLQYAMLREALHLVDSGVASKEDVDRAVKSGIGRRLAITGPIETADLGGTHIFAAISEMLLPELSNTTEISPTLAEAVKRGDLGYSTGRGIYVWPPEKLEEIRQERQQVLIEWLRKDKKRQR